MLYPCFLRTHLALLPHALIAPIADIADIAPIAPLAPIALAAHHCIRSVAGQAL